MSLIRILLSFLLVSGTFMLYGQSIPIDFPLQEFEIRKAVIEGRIEGLSFSHRPFQIIKTDTTLDKNAEFISKGVITRDYFTFKILAPQQNFEYNTTYPFGWNNGAMIRSRGLQSQTSAGFFTQIGPVIAQFKPTYVFAQNRSYETFPPTFSQNIYDQRVAGLWNYVDYPDYFGNRAYSKFSFGNSFLGFRYKKWDLVLSNESLWWGPGHFQSLTMTNNAPGFQHLSIKSNRGLNSPIGAFHIDLLVGKLQKSGFLQNESLAWLRKRNDWRYLSALNISYQPNWFKGFEIGFIRTLQQYYKTTKETKEYFPVLLSLSRKSTGGGADELDQQATIYMHFTFPKASGEVYAEIGRNDSPWNLRDFNMSPDHSLAYIFGFSKYFNIGNHEAQWITEVIKLSKGGTGVFRDEPAWYLNNNILHGYSHRGEIVGSGLRPGSNAIHNRFHFETKLGRLGLQFDRIANEQDFYYSVLLPNGKTTPWIDLSTGVSFAKTFTHLVLYSELNWVRSLNYMWGDKETTVPFVNQHNKNNLFIRTQMAYVF